ncbi:hypothetical protein D5086_008813 [Populus alba]|uniref:Uncharacterized protein n=1 Tax=Populus alba TaxID=43335 RepID=A0ACC4CH56_POPAL
MVKDLLSMLENGNQDSSLLDVVYRSLEEPREKSSKIKIEKLLMLERFSYVYNWPFGSLALPLTNCQKQHGKKTVPSTSHTPSPSLQIRIKVHQSKYGLEPQISQQ